MTREYLEEVAKLADLVDVTLCSCIYMRCNVYKGRLFRNLKGTEFVDLLNLKLSPSKIEELKLEDGANQRIYYMIHCVSQKLVNSQMDKIWIQEMLEVCNLDPKKYEKHHLDVLQESASKKNKEFAKDIKDAFERADSINLTPKNH